MQLIAFSISFLKSNRISSKFEQRSIQITNFVMYSNALLIDECIFPLFSFENLLQRLEIAQKLSNLAVVHHTNNRWRLETPLW